VDHDTDDDAAVRPDGNGVRLEITQEAGDDVAGRIDVELHATCLGEVAQRLQGGAPQQLRFGHHAINLHSRSSSMRI
jgi:hypothetical protein